MDWAGRQSLSGPLAPLKCSLAGKRYSKEPFIYPQEGEEDERGLDSQALSPESRDISHWAPSSPGFGSPFC